jgi:hypothetical protein
MIVSGWSRTRRDLRRFNPSGRHLVTYLASTSALEIFQSLWVPRLALKFRKLFMSGHSVVRCCAMQSEDNPGTNMQKHDPPGNMLTVPEDIAARVREQRRILAQALATEFENPEPHEEVKSPETTLLFAALIFVAVPVIGFLIYKRMTQDYALFLIPTVIFAAGFAVAFWAQERLRGTRERAAKALHGLSEALGKHDDD